MSNVETTPGQMVRTSAGLRDALFDELDGLRLGTSNPARANAVAKLAGQVVDTVRMEIELQRYASKVPKGIEAQLPKPVQLSNAQ